MIIALICCNKHTQIKLWDKTKPKLDETEQILTSKFNTTALSRPRIVDGYDRFGSRILRSRAWIWTRCMIAYLSTSSVSLSPVATMLTQLRDDWSFVFFPGKGSAAATAFPLLLYAMSENNPSPSPSEDSEKRRTVLSALPFSLKKIFANLFLTDLF